MSYHQWEQYYRSLKGQWNDNWSDGAKYQQLVKMKHAKEQVLQGRLDARDAWGVNADEGHDQRIQHIESDIAMLKQSIGYHEGTHDLHKEEIIKLADPKYRMPDEKNPCWGNYQQLASGVNPSDLNKRK